MTKDEGYALDVALAVIAGRLTELTWGEYKYLGYDPDKWGKSIGVTHFYKPSLDEVKGRAEEVIWEIAQR